VTSHDQRPFEDAQIREAERRLIAALESPDPTAWVYEYAEDAVFDAGGEHPARGREALLAMARSMRQLSNASIRPLQTAGCGDLATVWFDGSWLSGPVPEARRVFVRGVIVWRRQQDGRWRMALEHIS